MTASETLATGVLVAIVGWAIKSLVGLYLRRKAIVGALLSDIQTRIDSWDTNKRFLDRLIDTDMKPGQEVPYSALFEPSKSTLFDALLSELITHLPDHFPNVSKLYGAFKEAEDLMAGILRDITIWKEEQHILSEGDIRYLRAKRDRIVSYVFIFKKKEISRLAELPTDYRGIQGTELVTGTIP